MTTRESFFYSLKVWLTSWFFTPMIVFIFFGAYECIFKNMTLHELTIKPDGLLGISGLELLGMIYLVSFFFSLPFWILLWPCCKFISGLGLSTTTHKIIISITASLFLVVVFGIFNSGPMSVTGLPWYISLLFGIWYYKFRAIQPTSKKNISIDDHLIIPKV